MKYACVQKYYDDGSIKISVRPAIKGEQWSHVVNSDHDKWVNIFDSENDAEEYGKSKLV